MRYSDPFKCRSNAPLRISWRLLHNTTVPDIAKRLLSELKTLRWAAYNRLRANARTERDVINNFHKLYMGHENLNQTWTHTHWLGTQVFKCPLDLWIYQEIMHEIKPDVIIETGTASGGSALFLATLCDLLGGGAVITVDIEEGPGRPSHDRICYLKGSSTSPEIFQQVRSRVKPRDTVLVILDSNHTKDHVYQEMEMYGPLVTVGSYLIVEDTHVNGHPISPGHGPGPMEAVNAFLPAHGEFTADASREKFYMTFNRNGYLRKIK